MHRALDVASRMHITVTMGTITYTIVMESSALGFLLA